VPAWGFFSHVASCARSGWQFTLAGQIAFNWIIEVS
jgi:hypothetical protein